MCSYGLRLNLGMIMHIIICCAGAGDSEAGTICSLPFNCSSNHDEKMVKVSTIVNRIHAMHDPI